MYVERFMNIIYTYLFKNTLIYLSFVSPKRALLSYFFSRLKHYCLCLFNSCLQVSFLTKCHTQYIALYVKLPVIALLLSRLQRANLIPVTLALQEGVRFIQFSQYIVTEQIK